MGRPRIPEQTFEQVSFEARFRPSDVARLLDRSDDTVRRLVKKGVLGHVKLGGHLRFTEKHIKDYLASITKRPGITKMSGKARGVLGI